MSESNTLIQSNRLETFRAREVFVPPNTHQNQISTKTRQRTETITTINTGKQKITITSYLKAIEPKIKELSRAETTKIEHSHRQKETKQTDKTAVDLLVNDSINHEYRFTRRSRTFMHNGLQQ